MLFHLIDVAVWNEQADDTLEDIFHLPLRGGNSIVRRRHLVKSGKETLDLEVNPYVSLFSAVSVSLPVCVCDALLGRCLPSSRTQFEYAHPSTSAKRAVRLKCC